jgi:signal transduction histidine kinase
LILADELMILCGLVAPLTRGLERFAFLSVAMACFGFIIYHSLFALVDITRRADGLSVADAGRVKCIAALKMIAWTVYPAVYFAVLFGVMTPARQHEIYLYNDVLTKFSYSLVISAGSMRFVEMVDQKRTQLTAHMAGMQRTFFFNITHELRTPLNSIIGFNTLAMESGELTEFTESFIKASLTSAEALLSLINQILDVAKFEGAKDAGSSDGPAIELSEDVFTLRQLIEQVTDISQKASSSGVDLVIHIEHPEHFNTKFVGDFFRLRQCCVNLVDNAIKYSSNVQGRSSLVEFTMSICRARGQRAGSARGERGGGDSRGQRDQQSEKGDESIFDDVRDVSGITFSVKDNGVGIPAAKQHNLFVPFSQPADHKAAKEKGTGLGLVITKNIIECMGGEIEFESKEDEGTKFFFTVDFKHARLSAVDYEEEFEGATDLGFGSAVSGGGLDTEHEQSLPANARVVLHPGMSASSRKHVVNILKCFGGRAGVNYVRRVLSHTGPHTTAFAW